VGRRQQRGRELGYLLKLSEALKLAKYAGTEVKHLEGKEIALIFEKPSTRTRSAFEVGAYDQGAHVTYLDPASRSPKIRRGPWPVLISSTPTCGSRWASPRTCGPTASSS
jgi:aspartate carbamoyltransferase catalytic subunit